MYALTVKDVIIKEYNKFVERSEKYGIDPDMDVMSNLELAGNLYEEMEGDLERINDYIKDVNRKTKNRNKFRWYTIFSIIQNADQPAAELFEHPCSLPGTLISKICSQSKGAPISDDIYNRYFNKDTATQHPINLQSYYSVEHNRKDDFYYLMRDLEKSPRPDKKNNLKITDEAANIESESSEDQNYEEELNSSSEAETTGEESQE